MSRFVGARQREDYLGTTSQGIGSVPAAVAPYVAADEYGDAFRHTLELSLNRLPVTVSDTTGIGHGTVKLYDFPECRFLLEGGNCDMQVDWSASTLGAAGSGDMSLGTAGTADGTLSGAEVDLMASSALTDPFVAGIGSVAGSLVKTTEFDGSGGAKSINLNIIVDDTDITDGESDTVYLTGTIVMCWLNYGDRRTFS